jgi:hypothetical protein
MEKLSFEKFAEIIKTWEYIIETEHELSEKGICLEEFTEEYYSLIEVFAKLIFKEKIDDIYDYIYDMSDLSIEELYNLIYEV